MVLVQMIEMNQTVLGIVDAVRKKAEQLGIVDGVVAVCCTEREGFEDMREGNKCFYSLLAGEDSLKIFPLQRSESSFTEGLANDAKNFEHFGDAAKEIAAAAFAYHSSKGHELTSRDMHAPIGCGGCVVYPLTINRKPCGKIYVSVAGGNERQNEVCAWEAYEAIVNGIRVCRTTNPGPAFYGIPEL